ncbi:MAG: ABC transporter substrate-binding protein [Oscillospiraceae bacterium]|nr:ABC transporter substrate-binding protein [Oscillospiraceae bacterium]
MKKMRSILCLLMAVLMLFALTACGGGKTDGGKTPSGEDASAKFNPGPKGDEKITLRIGTTGYLGRFLSGLAPEESHSACNAVFDSIFRVDPWTKQIKSDVLDDWYWEDEHHFIMKLHDGVYFSNGQKATSEDLLFSYENHQERGSNYLSGMYLDLDKCEIVDDMTVRFYCEQQNTRISTAYIHLYCKSWSREVGWDSPEWYYPVASGAYYVKEYVADDYMVLHVRDDYWKHSIDEYYVEEYYYKYYPEAATLFMELELGNLDLCVIQSTDYSRYMSEDNSDKNYNVVLDATGSTMYMNFGFKDHDIWYNKDLRLAFAYGINWEEVGMLTLGDFYVANNGFAPKESPSYYDAGTREYDPEKAAEYLKKAGYEPGELSLKACMMDNASYKNFGQAVKYYIEKMGVNIDIQYADVSASIANWVQGGYNNDINLLFAAGGDARQCVTGSLNQANLWPGVTFAYVDDDHFQELYAKLCDPNTTQEDIYKYEKEIQQYIFDECLIIPFAEMNSAFGYDQRVIGPEMVKAITFSNRYQLTELGLRSNWERYQ